jgi:polysaccharide pyruvyl transferase WcaK-like protein
MIHHVYANQSNAGDWLSAQGIQSLLGIRAVQEHFCDEPFVDGTIAALSEAGPDDFIIIGGGGLFMDYFLPFWEKFRSIASRAPFCIWGVGNCDMKRQSSRLPRKLITEVVRQSSLCVVRDELTRCFLGDSRLPLPVPCPSILAIEPAGAPQPRLLHVDHYNNVGEEIYEKLVAISQCFAQRTGRSYRQTNNLIPKGKKEALRTILGYYESADLVFSSRLHGCILALAMHRPVLAISGDHKVESFMEAAGLGDWVLCLDEVDSVADRLEQLHKQILPVAFIEHWRAENRRVGRQVLQLLQTHSTLNLA